MCLIASGGHTLLAHVTDARGLRVLGRTLDDAAGEAFDKGARMLGLGYPGGAALERLAAGGRSARLRVPRLPGRAGPRRQGTGRQAFEQGLDFSFAGLKTALLYRLRELSEPELAGAGGRTSRPPTRRRSSSSLIDRAPSGALEQTGLDRLALGGGVAANGELRRRLASSARACTCRRASCAPTTPR